ncbi:hypothetical protein MAA5396_03904 [Marinovum algicola]|jgi:hypothetical protein|uniref:Uncharacterized protein n=1 Tax=Marinovum algicola TaxID=42444 RepID=A0A975WD76_9RHOB|nr:hypothetical protein SAMN04487940_11697 [Marinovum algicola]SLN70720.1 hypothetical protein MAA5396_03904 [Marinovum algicola]
MSAPAFPVPGLTRNLAARGEAPARRPGRVVLETSVPGLPRDPAVKEVHHD